MSKKCLAPGCNNPQFGGGYCGNFSHQRMRTDDRYLKSQQRQKEKKIAWAQEYEMPKITKKQAERNRKYLARLPSYRAENPICCFPGCNCATEEVHHSEGRIGDRLLDEKTWRPLCTPHHKWAEAHPEEARKLNLTASRLT